MKWLVVNITELITKNVKIKCGISTRCVGIAKEKRESFCNFTKKCVTIKL